MSENTPPILSNDEQVAPNPFDPERLRIDLSFAEGIGVKKALVTVPVRKPNGQDFIRAHPDPSFRLPVATIELKDDRETYLVIPDIARDIPGEYVMSTMHTCINRAGSSSCGRCGYRARMGANSRGTTRPRLLRKWR